MRIVVFPVVESVYSAKLALSSSFALPTVTSMFTQSPADATFVALSEFFDSHPWTALVDADAGLTYAST